MALIRVQAKAEAGKSLSFFNDATQVANITPNGTPQQPTPLMTTRRGLGLPVLCVV
jgi:hypothetical protein